MNFNTAIFYDIENLIGGYRNFDMLANLDLKMIFAEIKQKHIGKVAIQKAYANWSDAKLNILKNDIVELGIEPIQMFGFGRGCQKNASDIQLAIDAMEVALTKSHIDIFVIVSGDGGFSFLAKKLHEYGKTVIGCAHRNAVNRVFESVSDEFIWLEPPKELEFSTNQTTSSISLYPPSNVITQDGTTLNNDPTIRHFVMTYPSVIGESNESIINMAREIFNFLAKDRESYRLMSTTGLNISTVSQLLSYRISNFSYYRFGFVKLVDFLRLVLFDTSYKLMLKKPSEYRLFMNFVQVNHYESVECINEIGEIHTVGQYRKLLEKGSPSFKQFNQNKIITMCQYLAENKYEFQNISLNDMLERLNIQFQVDPLEIKSLVYALIAGECILREPEIAKISEQKLFFVPQNAEQALTRIKKIMREKLVSVFGELNEEEFEKILF